MRKCLDTEGTETPRLHPTWSQMLDGHYPTSIRSHLGVSVFTRFTSQMRELRFRGSNDLSKIEGE